MRLIELSDNELFGVLMCGQKPQDGFTIDDYVKEWNRRCDNGMGYEVAV